MADHELAAKKRKKRKGSCIYAPLAPFRGQARVPRAEPVPPPIAPYCTLLHLWFAQKKFLALAGVLAMIPAKQ
jgi:hypothetical protein